MGKEAFQLHVVGKAHFSLSLFDGIYEFPGRHQDFQVPHGRAECGARFLAYPIKLILGESTFPDQVDPVLIHTECGGGPFHAGQLRFFVGDVLHVPFFAVKTGGLQGNFLVFPVLIPLQRSDADDDMFLQNSTPFPITKYLFYYTIEKTLFRELSYKTTDDIIALIYDTSNWINPAGTQKLPANQNPGRLRLSCLGAKVSPIYTVKEMRGRRNRIGGQRPPGGQPSLDREGGSVADGWDDGCLFAHMTEMIFHRLKHQLFKGKFFYREILPPIQPGKRYDLFVPPPLRGAPLSKGARICRFPQLSRVPFIS